MSLDHPESSKPSETTGKSRFKNRVKQQLVQVDNHVYINPSDPQYYEKVLRYIDPHSAEAHYKLGQKHEEKGSFYNALYHYREAARYSSSSYYVVAKNSIQRIEQMVNGEETPPGLPSAGESGRSAKRRKLLVVLLVLFCIMLLSLLFGKETIRASLSQLKSWDVGTEVVYETVDVPYVIYLPQDEPARSVERLLYRKAVEMGGSRPHENIQLYGVLTSDPQRFQKVVPMTDDNDKEIAVVIAEYHADVDASVKIRFFHREFSDRERAASPLTIVGANLVRTALQTYIEDKGGAPRHIDRLVGDYPDNYLSFIPLEAVSGSNQISGKYNGQGGWVYDRNAAGIAEMFYPNIPGAAKGMGKNVNGNILPFEPVEIIVSKNDYRLKVTSGSYEIAGKPAGVGKDDRTPEKDMVVRDRVLEPAGEQRNVYGAAGLGMGDYAIHGTFDESSIHGNKSLGCIRLSNRDILDIYPFVPKGAHVRIVKDAPSGSLRHLNGIRNSLLPSAVPGIDQSPEHVVFHWLG